MTYKDVSCTLKATKQYELHDPIFVLKYQNMVRLVYLYDTYAQKEIWKYIKPTVVRSWVLRHFLFLFSSNS